MHKEPAPHSLAAVQLCPQEGGVSQLVAQPAIVLQKPFQPVQAEQEVGKHFFAPLDDAEQAVPAQQSACEAQVDRQHAGARQEPLQEAVSTSQASSPHERQVGGTQVPASERTVPAQQPPSWAA